MLLKSITLRLILSTIILTIVSCDKATDPPQATVPVLTTTAVTGITSSSATSGGNITSDGGAAITSRGVCWGTNSSPTVTDSKTTDGTGTGSFVSTITGLTANTTYNVRAYATNSAGTGYGNVLAFTSTTANGNTVTDIDGNVYHTVIIGTQTWLVENLKSTKYRNGDSIPNILDDATWDNLTTGAYCDYNNDPINSATYGRLYNWYSVNDVRNIAPAGWHVPSDAEWMILINHLGGLNLAGGKLKETGTVHWRNPNTGATNVSGFTALPGGFRGLIGSFGDIGVSAYIWSASEDNINKAWFQHMNYSNSLIDRINFDKYYGFTVRCIKD